MTIKIPVSADFDPKELEQKIQQINKAIASMGSAVAKANGEKFEPITLESKRDLDYFLKQSQQLLKIQGELNKRMSASGQGGKSPFEANWSKMYLDEKVRLRKMREALVFMGASFEADAPAAPGGRPPHVPPRVPPRAPPPPTAPRSPWVGVGVGAAQAGLQGLNGASGGAGGVAAGALGTGMSAGFGAGLMGLLGGMLALGVGKLVGAATENLDKAQNNEIAYDRLKRTLGDVNVSFEGLKGALKGASDNVKVTYEEGARLGTQFARLSNLSSDQYKELSGELQTGVGLSRAYGLDPSTGVGVLGSMRGIGVNRNEQDSRKFALLIGETIAKSDAFSKADEVMEAIAGYATQQTRNSLGGANVAGFAGMYSALVGSGIPGLDPAGAGSMLSRVNAALMAGGAKGEASQFYTAMIGQRNGLNPFQMQLWREGGAFATKDSVFGGDSAVAQFYRRNGMSMPGGGSQTFLAATLDELRKNYKGDQLLNATSNHLGISMSQAAAMHLVNPNQIGEMERRMKASGVDLTSLNAGGIASMSKVMFGSAADRQAVATDLLGRTGSGKLSASERDSLLNAMSGSDAEAQKEILAQLVATRDQEQTQGKDIRDSKTILDNIKTSIAEKLIPYVQEMRHGIMYMAGAKDGKSPADIAKDVLRLEAKGRQDSIRGYYQNLIDEQGKAIADARAGETPLDPENAAKNAEISRQKQEAALAEIKRLEAERDGKIAEDNARLQSEIGGVDQGQIARQREYDAERRVQQGGSLGEAPAATVIENGKMTRGYRNNNPGNLVDTIDWKGMTGSDGRFAVFGSVHDGYRAMGKNLLAYQNKHGLNTVRGIITRWAPPGENDTAAYIAQMCKELGVGPDDPLNLQDQKTLSSLMRGIAKHENGYQRHDQNTIDAAASDALGRGMPMPADAAGGAKDQRFILDATPIEIIHRNERGEQIGQQRLATNIRPAAPFGTARYTA